jgi:hypothetical protein
MVHQYLSVGLVGLRARTFDCNEYARKVGSKKHDRRDLPEAPFLFGVTTSQQTFVCCSETNDRLGVNGV